MEISRQRIPAYFYFGTLISSVGSMTLSVALIAFMLRGGFSLLQVGIVIGLSRLLPLMVSIFAGHRLDKFSPRKTILWAELGAGASSGLLLCGWIFFDSNFSVILAAMIMRSFFTSLQLGSRSQMAKILSDSSYQSNSRNAIWLNKVTQGATVFGGVLSWVSIQFTSFPAVIIFDALTFIVNGVILFLLPIDEKGQAQPEGEGILKKFQDFYHFNFRAASLDAFLALSVMGTSAFTARLAGTSEAWISLFVISYGLSVWIAGYLERLPYIQSQRAALWILLSGAFIFLALIPGPSGASWLACFAKDTLFWILFHRISAHIQNDTPKDMIGAVTFARNAQLITILAVGELIVGLWKNVVPLQMDCAMRAGICLTVAIVVAAKSVRTGTYEKAHL